MNTQHLSACLALVLTISSCAETANRHSGAQEGNHDLGVETRDGASATKEPIADPHALHAAPNKITLPSGYEAFDIDPRRAVGMGLSTAQVEERKFQRTIRTTGVVALDETRTSHVHAKVRGFIERVTADFIGKAVKAGSPLCSIYSQEVYAAELEFLSVLEQTSSRAERSGPFAAVERDAGTRLVAAARRRLSLWDVPASEIARLEETRTPQRTFALLAPRTGIIVSKQALAGMFIDPGTELYVVSDVSRLWILADVYGADLPWVQVGAKARLRIEGLEAEPREASVAFLPPTMEEATRTLKVRFEIDNKDGRVRPGAFATVEMGIDLGSSLAIPENAVIHAGDRDIAFVVQGTRIEPRAVELGPLVNGYYRVVRGVSAAESVAVGAQFLIDSESRLRATSGPGAQHAGH